MIFITETLNKNQMADIIDEDEYITVVLPIPLYVVMHFDTNCFLDFISKQILGDLSLQDIRYTLKGIYEDKLLFLIKGNVSFFLENEGVISL